MMADQVAGTGVSEAGKAPVLWSLEWHGYARRRNELGDVVDEGPVSCVLKVFYAGNWIVCGHNGAVVVRDGDAALLERLAACLMGTVVAGQPPPG